MVSFLVLCTRRKNLREHQKKYKKKRKRSEVRRLLEELRLAARLGNPAPKANEK